MHAPFDPVGSPAEPNSGTMRSDRYPAQPAVVPDKAGGTGQARGGKIPARRGERCRIQRTRMGIASGAAAGTVIVIEDRRDKQAAWRGATEPQVDDEARLDGGRAVPGSAKTHLGAGAGPRLLGHIHVPAGRVAQQHPARCGAESDRQEGGRPSKYAHKLEFLVWGRVGPTAPRNAFVAELLAV